MGLDSGLEPVHPGAPALDAPHGTLDLLDAGDVGDELGVVEQRAPGGNPVAGASMMPVTRAPTLQSLHEAELVRGEVRRRMTCTAASSSLSRKRAAWPPGHPVVAHVVAPQLQVYAGALGLQQGREVLALFGRLVGALARGHDPVDVADALELGPVGDPAKVEHGLVEVVVLVAVSIHPAVEVVGAAHGDDVAEPAGVLGGGVHRVVGADGGACGHEARGASGVPLDVGQQLVGDVAVVSLQTGLLPGPGVGFSQLCPALVSGVDLDASGCEERLEHLDHQEPFVVEAVGGCGREEQHGDAHIAPAGHGHLLAHAVAVPGPGGVAHGSVLSVGAAVGSAAPDAAAERSDSVWRQNCTSP